jgi:protein-S-isoprenylcysteine O-methyltransferase Ste14
MPVWLRAAIFIAIAPGTIAGWLPWNLAGSPHPWSETHGAWRLGALLTAVGWSILLSCARDFALRGRGTPAPYDAPRQLVVSGLYRYTRNPMYVGVLTAVLGQAIWFRSTAILWYALAAALGFHGFVVVYEEPTLTRLFGDDYLEYCRQVPRWLPTFRPPG